MKSMAINTRVQFQSVLTDGMNNFGISGVVWPQLSVQWK